MDGWKKGCLGLFILVMLLYNVGVGTAEGTSAKAACVLEARTGRILFAHNMDTPLPMASTTKVMTALLALEMGDLSAPVTTSRNAYGMPGTSIYLGQGETLALQEMLYGLMLASGNDAAVAIAEHIGGTVEDFCRMMDERAAALGAKSTHFVNPNGLPAAGHVTTALDLALIAREAMKIPVFREIVSIQRASIPWEGRDYMRVLRNKNRLLSDYEGATGIKTGFTKAAGRCLVFGARRGDMEVIGVVLGCGDWFDEAARLMDLCFSRYTLFTMLPDGERVGEVTILGGDTERLPVRVQGDLAAPITMEEMPLMTLEYEEEVAAPKPAGTQIGWATLRLSEDVLARQPLVLGEAARKAPSPLTRWLWGWPLMRPEGDSAREVLP